MKCMKCGSAVPSGQVFCDECLADMAEHPVKPGTPVVLPQRSAQSGTKRQPHYRRVRKPEEQILSLKRSIRWLMLLIAVLIIALTLMIYMTFSLLNKQNSAPTPGQNYGTVSTGEMLIP